MKKMQILVSKMVEDYSLEISPEMRFIDLTSEVGELGKDILKGNSYGKRQCEKTMNFEDEIGDVLFSLICIANTMEVDLESSLNHTLAKYKKRFEEKSNTGSENNV